MDFHMHLRHCGLTMTRYIFMTHIRSARVHELALLPIGDLFQTCICKLPKNRRVVPVLVLQMLLLLLLMMMIMMMMMTIMMMLLLLMLELLLLLFFMMMMMMMMMVMMMMMMMMMNLTYKRCRLPLSHSRRESDPALSTSATWLTSTVKKFIFAIL